MTPAVGRPRQEELEFEANSEPWATEFPDSQGYTVRPCHKQWQQQHWEERRDIQRIREQLFTLLAFLLFWKTTSRSEYGFVL